MQSEYNKSLVQDIYTQFQFTNYEVTFSPNYCVKISGNYKGKPFIFSTSVDVLKNDTRNGDYILSQFQKGAEQLKKFLHETFPEAFYGL